MDVSDKRLLSSARSHEGTGADNGPEISCETGHELLDTVASLTGLPEDLVQQELQDLVAAAGQDAGRVTLDQLRQAMLLYLEALAVQEEGLMEPDSDRPVIPSA